MRHASKHAPITTGYAPADDSLFDLQLSVARRADELARRVPCAGSPVRARETWAQAERELLVAAAADGGRGARSGLI